MFTRRGGEEYCQIHPDVLAINSVAKSNGKYRQVQSCPACDQLVEELKTQKATAERHLEK
jgi:hypothetical protein